MSEIYIKYSEKNGFSRSADKAGLSGKVVNYADFKGISGNITPDSTDEYGIVLDSKDVHDFIENYEADSVFTDAEKA